MTTRESMARRHSGAINDGRRNGGEFPSRGCRKRNFETSNDNEQVSLASNASQGTPNQGNAASRTHPRHTARTSLIQGVQNRLSKRSKVGKFVKKLSTRKRRRKNSSHSSSSNANNNERAPFQFPPQWENNNVTSMEESTLVDEQHSNRSNRSSHASTISPPRPSPARHSTRRQERAPFEWKHVANDNNISMEEESSLGCALDSSLHSRSSSTSAHNNKERAPFVFAMPPEWPGANSNDEASLSDENESIIADSSLSVNNNKERAPFVFAMPPEWLGANNNSDEASLSSRSASFNRDDNSKSESSQTAYDYSSSDSISSSDSDFATKPNRRQQKKRATTSTSSIKSSHSSSSASEGSLLLRTPKVLAAEKYNEIARLALAVSKDKTVNAKKDKRGRIRWVATEIELVQYVMPLIYELSHQVQWDLVRPIFRTKSTKQVLTFLASSKKKNNKMMDTWSHHRRETNTDPHPQQALIIADMIQAVEDICGTDERNHPFTSGFFTAEEDEKLLDGLKDRNVDTKAFAKTISVPSGTWEYIQKHFLRHRTVDSIRGRVVNMFQRDLLNTQMCERRANESPRTRQRRLARRRDYELDSLQRLSKNRQTRRSQALADMVWHRPGSTTHKLLGCRLPFWDREQLYTFNRHYETSFNDMRVLRRTVALLPGDRFLCSTDEMAPRKMIHAVRYGHLLWHWVNSQAILVTDNSSKGHRLTKEAVKAIALFAMRVLISDLPMETSEDFDSFLEVAGDEYEKLLDVMQAIDGNTGYLEHHEVEEILENVGFPEFQDMENPPDHDGPLTRDELCRISEHTDRELARIKEVIRRRGDIVAFGGNNAPVTAQAVAPPVPQGGVSLRNLEILERRFGVTRIRDILAEENVDGVGREVNS